MARILTLDQAEEIAKKFGSKPAFILEIDFGAGIGTVSYGDVDFSDVTGITIKGKILSVSGLDAVLKLGSTGTSTNLSIIVDDTDEIIKDALSIVDIQRVPCRIYQAYIDLGEAEKFLLFDGELASPYVWSEQEHTFRFDVVTNIEDQEIGFSPEEGEFEFIADSAVGKAWPLCFGRPIRVPAVKITDRVRGTSLTRYGALSQGDLNSLCSAAQALDFAENEKRKADNNPGFSDENYADVIDSLNDAQISLNTAKEALIFDSPTQETNIELFIEVCKDIAAQERNEELFLAQSIAAQEAIDALETAIDVLNDQITVAEHEEPPNNILLSALHKSLNKAEFDLATEEINLQDAVLNLFTTQINLAFLETSKLDLEVQLTQIVLTEIIVDNGENFPQDILVKIIINGLKFSGIFSEKTFTIQDILPTDTNVELDANTSGNANELFLKDGTIDISRKYCYIPSAPGIIYIESQQGKRCQFSPILFKLDGTLGELFGITIDGEPAEREVYSEKILDAGDTISATSAIIFDAWKQNVRSSPDFANGLSKAGDADWGLEIGDEVYLDDDYVGIYIANLIPSSEIKEVFARRTVRGVDQLLPVPSSRYTINLNESIAGQQATTIRFDKPLSQYIDEDWTDDVFVTLVSSEGPNTADILEFLIETFTDLSVDSTSFTSVRAAITLYPSDFALLDRVDALITIEQIAWQARCAIIIKNGVAFIKYLAAQETEIITVSESDVDNFEITLSDSDNLVTKLDATWQRDLSADEIDHVVLRNNVRKYGLLEQEFNFYIYNIKELVVKSATFWLIRLSNTWKIITFTAYLDTLELESFDTVELSFEKGLIAVDKDIPSLDPVLTPAIVQRAEYNSDSHEIQYEILTPILSGDQDPHLLFWPATADSGVEYPTDKDLFTGGG